MLPAVYTDDMTARLHSKQSAAASYTAWYLNLEPAADIMWPHSIQSKKKKTEEIILLVSAVLWATAARGAVSRTRSG